MTRPSGRLSLAPDVQSVARLDGGRGPTKSEAPAATVVAVPVCEAGTRGLSTLTALTNEGADMAQSTRTSGRSDSGTPATAVKITPAMHSRFPVPTTPTVA
jgi:hypothetical protein